MNTEGFKRKLTTLFSADVAGYSRLMGQDEAYTVRTLTAYRQVMSELITQHRGRVVDSPGDNLLAEFPSVVDAVQCAVAVQKELAARNAELDDDRRMEFRIGINIGDVIEEEDRVYGDGVNITARLEGLAEPGGICISRTAFDQIETKLPLGYKYLGEQTVKNIAKPVGAYQVVMESRVNGDRKDNQALYVPEEQSIAVLPFTNMSGDPEQEYFSDGLTEEIITALSKISSLFVIASNSTFSYKGKPVRVQQIGRELGVKYVLEGSVRKAGQRVRITTQLIDAATGHHLWAERYDRDLQDIFALQDEITMKILIALRVKLTEGEQARLHDKDTDNLDCFMKVLEGQSYILRFNKNDNLRARQLFEEALALDPESCAAMTSLGSTYLIEMSAGWSGDPEKSLLLAHELAQKALARDNPPSYTHSLLGHIYLVQGQHEKAIAELEQAITLNPNGADAYAFLGSALIFTGHPDEAIELIMKAMRSNPMPPNWYHTFLAHAFRNTGRYREAITVLQEVLERNPYDANARIGLVASHIMAGQEEEGQRQAAEFLKLNPDFSLAHIEKSLQYKDPTDRNRDVEILRRAGLT
jgi:adenylate cyclase